MYSEKDWQEINKLLKKRWLVTLIPAGLILAAAITIFVYGQLNRSEHLWKLTSFLVLLGGGYLLWRRVISYHIPVSYLATVFLLVSLLHLGDRPLLWAAYNLCSGGVLLGAFFMATDYVTSPVTRRGQLLYGIGCGALTVLFRRTGLFPGGVTYAILLMNGCTWTIDRLCQPRRFGAEKGAQP